MSKKSLFVALFIIAVLSTSTFAQTVENDFYGGKNQEKISKDDERKIDAFENALRDLGEDTSGLREMIKSNSFSKKDLFERFDEKNLNKAVKAAGVEVEFAQTADFRYSEDRFGSDSQDYNFGPPKGEMMYGMLFQYIDSELNPRELMQQCSNPDAIVDKAILILKEKVGNFESVCDKMGKDIKECTARVESDCSMIGKPHFEEDEEDEIRRLEMKAWSTCPPDTDAMFNACVLRSKQYNQERLNYVDEICADRWEFEQQRVKSECTQKLSNRGTCDKDEFMKDCLGDSKPEDFERKNTPYEGCETMMCQNGYYCEYGKCIPFEKEPEKYNECKNGCNDECPGADRTSCVDGNRCECYYEENEERHNDGESSGGDSSSGGNNQEENNDNTNNENNQEKNNDNSNENDDSSESESDSNSNDNGEGFGSITGQITSEKYDDFVKKCEENFRMFREPECKQKDDYCTEEGYIKQCITNEKNNAQGPDGQIRLNCKINNNQQLKEAEKNCKRIEKDKSMCIEKNLNRCQEIGKVVGDCKEKFQETKIREFLLDEIEKRCAFAGDIEKGQRAADELEVVLAVNIFASDETLEMIAELLESSEKLLTLENTIVIKGVIKKENVNRLKSLPNIQRFKVDNLPEETGKASTAVKRVANKLMSVRGEDNELPDDVAYVVESEAADIAGISKNFAKIENQEDSKTLIYKFQRFFGMVKEAEEREIGQLEGNKEKLTQSIETLKEAATKVDDPVAKAVLLEQADLLSQQQEEINRIIVEKKKKAIGFFNAMFNTK